MSNGNCQYIQSWKFRQNDIFVSVPRQLMCARTAAAKVITLFGLCIWDHILKGKQHYLRVTSAYGPAINNNSIPHNGICIDGVRSANPLPLQRNCRHFGEIFIISCTGSQWRRTVTLYEDVHYISNVSIWKFNGSWVRVLMNCYMA